MGAKCLCGAAVVSAPAFDAEDEVCNDPDDAAAAEFAGIAEDGTCPTKLALDSQSMVKSFADKKGPGSSRHSKLLLDRLSPRMVSTTYESFIGKRGRAVTGARASGSSPDNCAI